MVWYKQTGFQKEKVDYSDPFVFGPEFAIENVPLIILMNLSLFPFLLWHLVPFHHLRFPDGIRSGHRNLTQKKSWGFCGKGLPHSYHRNVGISRCWHFCAELNGGKQKSFRMGWSSKIWDETIFGGYWNWEYQQDHAQVCSDWVDNFSGLTILFWIPPKICWDS